MLQEEFSLRKFSITLKISDEEDEDEVGPRYEPTRYYRKDHVFEKYDFKFRKFEEVCQLAVYAHKDRV